MKEVRREEKREGGGLEVYNWCAGRDVFMLQGFRGLNGKLVSFPPYQTRAVVQWAVTACYEILIIATLRAISKPA